MSEREQVWRERIEWQQWSGLTVAVSVQQHHLPIQPA